MNDYEDFEFNDPAKLLPKTVWLDEEARLRSLSTPQETALQGRDTVDPCPPQTT